MYVTFKAHRCNRFKIIHTDIFSSKFIYRNYFKEAVVRLKPQPLITGKDENGSFSNDICGNNYFNLFSNVYKS